MKLLLLFLLGVLTAYAAPQVQPAYQFDSGSLMVPEEDINLDDDGNFSLRFVNADGTMIQEEGVLVTDEDTGEDRPLIKMGVYSYTGNDGNPVAFVYDANLADKLETQKQEFS
ncbi:uncharacterized protein LOC107269004 [Cephus cinctus]|uniref:Uncharacterized protein LOC107269004 n=1 Tax=Cephus cinctus TaxID=211228 RepID=A0AAJ7BYZ7_CEPCN|nr:uncharacterized protein LOC107269004 [Cephus cinctus]